jgi:ligand-binding sensor domain-containing protein
MNRHQYREKKTLIPSKYIALTSFYSPMLYILILIIFLGTTLNAQVEIHENLNINDGMIYSQVTSIHKDKNGYMWFGTVSGVSRWDGHSFKNFIFPVSLSDNNCKWISEFSNGSILFATRKNIVQYANKKISKLSGKNNTFEHGISGMIALGNKLLVATISSGLLIFDGREFHSEKGLINQNITTLNKSNDSLAYLADKNNTIYSYNSNRLVKLLLPKLPSKIHINTLFCDNNNTLWIGTLKHGVFIVNLNDAEYFSKLYGLPKGKINSISNGNDDKIFVATSKGLAIYENYHLQSIINTKHGLSNNFVWQVFRDRNDLFYIGTDGGGVDIYRPGLFQTINMKCGLPHNTVWSICENENYQYYFGTDEGLAIYHQGKIKIMNKDNGLSGNMILALHHAADGTLYAATNENGVDAIYHNKITNINSKQGLDGPSVWTIAEDNAGLIYFGTYDGGINIWDGKTVIDTINIADGLPTNAIVSSLLCSDSSLFFGTDGGGVVKYSHGKIDTILLKNNTIWSIFEDKQGNYYFGTDDRGMIYLHNGQWDTINVESGLSHNSILGILQDENGIFYLSADNGLNVVDFSVKPVQIRTIGSRDGLAGDECNQGAYYKDSHGFLWFGTISGVSRYNPLLVHPDKIPPKIHITSIRLYNKELLNENKHEREFSYNENYFKFEFTGIDLVAPHKVKYRYRLSGVDNDWITTHRNFVQYTSLKKNNYKFEVIAGNEWGAWSKPVSFSFCINPPFWKTWWFLLLSLLIVVIPIIIIIRQRMQRFLVMERLRSKIAADLHDDIGAGLSEISILSAVIGAKTPPEVRQIFEPELEKIGHTARSIIDKMSDIVWMINPKKDAISGLINHLSDSFADIFEAKCIQFHTENIEVLKQSKLNMEYRQQLFMILKEAIHNAVKYSDADKITLSVDIQGKKLTVLLQDNGKGFEDSGKISGNGLHNMKERALTIGGDVSIQSRIGLGTKVTFQGVIK